MVLNAASWIICPFIDCQDYTDQALDDFLAQTGVDVRVLLINNGSTDEVRDHFERRAIEDLRIHLWSHQPPLPSLSATWNTALDFVWRCGGEQALVVNNDVRLSVRTYSVLSTVLKYAKALFVTAVGVKPEQFDPAADPQLLPASFDPDHATIPELRAALDAIGHGGPDFSCCLISKAAHEKYRFDESFIPAYGEDLDMHRRYMLGGDGDKIFSVNLPFAHFASRTINRSPEANAAFARRVGQSHAYYAAKWGGPCNQERYRIPFEAQSDSDGVTTPELQHALQPPQTPSIL